MSEEFGKSSPDRFCFGFLRSTLNCRLLTSFILTHYLLLLLVSLGCSAQICFANCSSQRRTKSSFISSNEVPVGTHTARNNHAQREHPGARESVSLIHSNLRPVTKGTPRKTSSSPSALQSLRGALAQPSRKFCNTLSNGLYAPKNYP